MIASTVEIGALGYLISYVMSFFHMNLARAQPSTTLNLGGFGQALSYNPI